MKKFLSSLLLIGLFSACGGSASVSNSNTSNSDTEFFFTYSTAEFSIDVPDDWEIIKAFPSDYPDELRVAFRNNVRNGDRVANLSILRENGPAKTTNDLAQSKLAQHEDTLLGYKLIEQEEALLGKTASQANSVIYTFSGKEESISDPLIFMQTYLADGNNAWTLTATYEQGEDEFVIDDLKTALKSFTLK